jgi:Tfp pilus assembly PilM family ATPase
MAVKGTQVGLDIGRYAAKAAWVRSRGNRFVVTRVESLRLPPDRQDNKAVIKSWIEKIGLPRAECVVGLSGQHAMFQPFTLAPGDQRTLEQAAGMEVLQFNEMASETMVYGYAPLELKPDERRMILAMARPMILDGLLELARTVGARAVDIVPGPVALFNAVMPCVEKVDAPLLLVNIGATATEVAVGVSGGLMFGRAFGSGGQMFTDALARAAGLPGTHAEAAKTRDASLQDETPRGAALRSCADLWITEFRSCLSVYRSSYGAVDQMPRRMLLAGKGATLRGLPEYLASKLGIEVVPLAQAVGPALGDDPAQFAVAVGLAVSGTEAATAPISLLPSPVRHELMFRRQKPFWVAAGVAAALVLGVSLVGGYRDTKRKEAVLETQRTSLKRRQQLVAELESVRKGTDYMISMSEPVNRLVRAGPLIRDLIATLAASIGERDWITTVCDADSYFSYQPPPEAAKMTPAGMRERRRQKAKTPLKGEDIVRHRRVIIEGFTRNPDLTSVRSLIEAIRGQKFVESADLLSADLEKASAFETESGRFDAGRFVIDVMLKEK